MSQVAQEFRRETEDALRGIDTLAVLAGTVALAALIIIAMLGVLLIMAAMAIETDAQGMVARGVSIETPRPKVEAGTVAMARVADRRFVLTMTTLAASSAFDQWTTTRMLQEGNYETDWLYGRHPSNGRIAGVALGQIVGEVAVAYVVKRWGRGRGRWLRDVWMIEPGVQAGGHVEAGIHNLRLKPVRP